jgi:hypothetical protein
MYTIKTIQATFPIYINTMRSHEKVSQQKQLFNSLEATCESARQEYDLTYVEVLGVLHMLQAIVTEEYLNTIQEDGE